jgi:hypothetical protein
VAVAIEELELSSLSRDGHVSMLHAVVEKYLKPIVHAQTSTLHTRIHEHTHAHTHTYTQRSTHTHTHTHTNTRTHTHTHTHIYTYTYTYIHIYIHTSQLAITTDGRLRVLLAR